MSNDKQEMLNEAEKALIKRHSYMEYTPNELDAAMEDINKEMFALQERMRLLRKERQLLDVLYIILHPDKALGQWQNVTKTLSARIRRCKEESVKERKPTCSKDGCLLEVLAKGLCYDHYHATKTTIGIEPPRQETPEDVAVHKCKTTNHKMVSKCCSAPTYEGKRHKAGDRYCADCNNACLWSLQNSRIAPENTL